MFNNVNNIAGGICSRVDGGAAVTITDTIAAGKITDVNHGKNVKSVVGYIPNGTVNFENVNVYVTGGMGFRVDRGTNFNLKFVLENELDKEEHEEVVEKQEELGVPYTIHAGEAGPASNVRDAVEIMGAWRIGHGGHSTEDPSVKQMMIDKQIPYEFCVTSNIQCHVQPSYEEHAMIELFRDGALVTMNSDNMTLSKVNIHSEMEKAITRMGFTEEDCHQLNVNAIKAAFLSEEEKEALIAKL